MDLSINDAIKTWPKLWKNDPISEIPIRDKYFFRNLWAKTMAIDDNKAPAKE